MKVLVVNPGSSTLKLRLLDAEDAILLDRELETPAGEVEASRLDELIAEAPPPDACGVRFVHGGAELRASVRVDEVVLACLEAVTRLAPLHNPPALAALRHLLQTRVGLPLVACFDTAFHATIPDAAAVYAIPWHWTTEWGMRRYGFHGLNHSWATRRAAELLGRPVEELRIVSCHLGSGSSLAAVRGGVSIDTTMGFTPLEGLVMSTRSGSLDPGILLWAQRQGGLSVDAVQTALETESGLLGISGISSDMRQVLEAADAGQTRAQLALAVFIHRLRAGIAAMAAALEGLDVLVFTGGIGERSPQVRSLACRGLSFLGLELDETANLAAQGDALVATESGSTAIVVVQAREDLEIARQVRSQLAG